MAAAAAARAVDAPTNRNQNKTANSNGDGSDFDGVGCGENEGEERLPANMAYACARAAQNGDGELKAVRADSAALSASTSVAAGLSRDKVGPGAPKQGEGAMW